MGLSKEKPPDVVTVENVEKVLERDRAVKVAGCDIDGIMRGKVMAKSKFISLIKSGEGKFGFCSVIFGWDMHDQTYVNELGISNKENGYHDVVAKIDLSSYRRIPWERDIPFFLVNFYDPDTDKTLCACPRSVLARATEELAQRGMTAMAGGRLCYWKYGRRFNNGWANITCWAAEYEFYMFQSPQQQKDATSNTATARFLQDNAAHKLQHLTEGMHGYSLTDPVKNQDWYYSVFEQCEQFKCDIEGWHTESGPGVFEAALKYGEVKDMADRAALFKFATKNISSSYGITPCFMAKPRANLPGNSGHMHISLTDSKTGANLFARDTTNGGGSKYDDAASLSKLGQQFLAGLLEGLPDIMPLLAPTVNSYKRLVENFWAPVTVSWGLEHRAASIRVIAPPTSDAKATRFEVRVPGADTNPYLALAGILACGIRGVRKGLDIFIPPLGKGQEVGDENDSGVRLSKSLKEANDRFGRKDGLAREVLGDEFVNHFSGTRDHEIRLWDEAVTDWEVRRYIEMV